METVKQEDAMFEPRAPSSSPLSEVSEGMMEAYEAETRTVQAASAEAVNGGDTVQEDDDTLFVPPTRSHRASLPIRSHAPLPRLTTPEADPEADRERIRRENLHRAAYEEVIATINKRSQMRKFLDTRNKIWNESLRKARTRIAEIEKEREELQDQIGWWREAKRKFNANWAEKVDVGVSGGRDWLWERKECFECFFRLEVDELGIDEAEDGEGEVYIKREEEDADVDMSGLAEVDEMVRSAHW